jgi:hypothetical protein
MTSEQYQAAFSRGFYKRAAELGLEKEANLLTNIGSQMLVVPALKGAAKLFGRGRFGRAIGGIADKTVKNPLGLTGLATTALVAPKIEDGLERVIHPFGGDKANVAMN